VRSLTRAELELGARYTPGVDLGPVRVFDGSGTGGQRRLHRLVLRLSRGRAVTLGNWVFLPGRADLDLPVLVHELVHCGQFQRWGALRYFWRGAAEQLRFLVYQGLKVGRNPYAYEAGTPPGTARGMEQQAQMVEDTMRRECSGPA